MIVLGTGHSLPLDAINTHLPDLGRNLYITHLLVRIPAPLNCSEKLGGRLVSEPPAPLETPTE